MSNIMAKKGHFLVIQLQVFFIIINTCDGENKSNFTTLLIFGNSTVDSGNNNNLVTFAKANHKPYGLNFPGHVPTGRFSDGKLIPDFIASILGIKEMVPPFRQPNLSNVELLSGVNFASSGSGYDDLTSDIFQAIPMSKQTENFKHYIDKISHIVGKEQAQRIISRAMIIISAGTNDFAYNLYNVPTRKLQFDTDGYQDFVQSRLQEFIKELYDLGCRIMVVSGLPPIGCLPLQLTAKLKNLNSSECLQNQNLDSQSYNDKLKVLLHHLHALEGSKILYSDIYKPMIKLINNPLKHGFVETRKGCCGTGLLEAGVLCTSVSSLCSNSSTYLFFDSVHPSEQAYRFVFEYWKRRLLPKLLNLL